MENKKPTLITIVVLLLIFTPLTIIGLLFRDNRHPLEENPTHEFFYKGHLWFYDSEDNYLSDYECMTEVCDYTTTIINDDTYGIKYYKDGVNNKLKLLNDKYTFLTDGAVVYLYDSFSGSTLQTYKGIKNYGTTINGDYYIVENNNDLWGVLMVNEALASILPFEYDFISLPNKLLNDNVLDSSKFIVLKDSKWFIVNNENSAVSGKLDDPIIDLNDNYIFTKNNNQIRIFSYDNYEYLTSFKVNDYIISNGYIGIVTDNYLLVYKHLGENYIKSVTLTNQNGKIELNYQDNVLSILIDDKVVDTINS